MINFSDIENARNRIDNMIHETPILTSSQLNRWSGGHRLFFKAECFQKIGAFKARGGANSLARLVENGVKPAWVIANSSGNHAQAVAWAGNHFGIRTRIFMPSNVSAVKAAATRAYGAEVVFGEDRAQVDAMTLEQSKKKGTFWIPPFNHRDVIAGQGSAAAEALNQINDIDAVFAPCGGGGLLSGTLIATRHLQPQAKVFGVEPANANDAAKSLRLGKIVRLKQTPNTLADGARTLSVGELTFEHLRQLDGFFEVNECAICYWTQWLNHLLKARIEPTSAMVMQAVWSHLKAQTLPQNILVILSGGNMDRDTVKAVWETDWLSTVPEEWDENV